MPAEGDVWSNDRSSGTDQNYHEETGTQGSNLQRSHVLRQGSFNSSLEAKCIFYNIDFRQRPVRHIEGWPNVSKVSFQPIEFILTAMGVNLNFGKSK